MRLDRLDAGILRLLVENARLSFREMAGKLDTTTPTVAARVRALEELGVIRGYRAEVDAALLGGARYVLRVRAKPAALREAAAALSKAPGVEEVAALSGGVLELRARLRPPNTQRDLHEAISGLPHVEGYESAEVLEVLHSAPDATLPEELDVRCHHCRGPIRGEPVRAKLDGKTHVYCCRQCQQLFQERYQRLRAGRSTGGQGGTRGRGRPAAGDASDVPPGR